MTHIAVEQLSFAFPDGWHASKYDEWQFYREQFSRMWDGIKAVDLIAIDPNRTGWLIEAKDYRRNPRTKPSDLPQEVARKAFDTLAGLLPARINSNHAGEVEFAGRMRSIAKLRIVLHLEQPRKHSRLFPRAINPADVQQKLRRLVKPIDPHPLVCERPEMHGLVWEVT